MSKELIYDCIIIDGGLGLKVGDAIQELNKRGIRASPISKNITGRSSARNWQCWSGVTAAGDIWWCCVEPSLSRSGLLP